ncbi:MAG: helix-turn-helix domain-containing protein [Bdellovibrionales bacterium]|nr:helix-turn-helix domain-containing protein [Bdellovibrionales bacterium]
MVTLVKTLMTLRGVNQTELSKQTGVSVTAISRFLNNSSELRSEAMLNILSSLGADVTSVVKKEISKALGDEDDLSIGEDIRFLLEQTAPITRKTITDTLIANFRNDKNPDTKNRIKRLRKYRDSIKTVRRQPC